MDHREIEEQAKLAEKMVIEGDTNALAMQLHCLTPTDRHKVILELKKMLKHDSSKIPNLPMLTFTDNGDLLSADLKDKDDGTKTHIVYDQTTGHTRTIDTKRPDGAKVHYEYDPCTGKRIYGYETDPDLPNVRFVWNRFSEDFDIEDTSTKQTVKREPRNKQSNESEIPEHLPRD